MIVVFVKNDIDVLDSGYKDAHDSSVFGIPYAYVKSLWPAARLEKKENLFITAHGNKKLIGDVGPTLELDAGTLAGIIKQIIPSGYTGDIYMSTCNSFEYAKALKKALGVVTSGSDFYGTKKSIDYKIEGPDGSNWHRVTA
ncbi:hypothetical protein JK358_20480 [Nocardia sp. 2]|uniref:Uncharacterized protein n=1 Tax=Nocardia acididurans TaxID=2802282 RepID=A0ABS1M7Z7_9NOCA|nr:hypothetical protein [Nocardia acididurans]MBL1076777.1 hypothetical protein [Nocardia acididurans]